ncbi:hypothetical protein QBC34DRAFT_385380 [Podospora aff. communis PSN243]|uniref:Secreted protein n=1 Tax=Podospora aff. communis PSN243 TaxID=3040156 RepID=A0AAV9GAT0_9PEZI|nr:hypothetical protein QBC34DRAFT_385380 [Podospora aff. communis PSN243]
MVAISPLFLALCFTGAIHPAAAILVTFYSGGKCNGVRLGPGSYSHEGPRGSRSECTAPVSNAMSATIERSDGENEYKVEFWSRDGCGIHLIGQGTEGCVSFATTTAAYVSVSRMYDRSRPRI